MHGAVAASYKGLREAADVESFYAFFACVATAEKFDTGLWIVCVEIYNLLRSESVSGEDIQ